MAIAQFPMSFATLKKKSLENNVGYQCQHIHDFYFVDNLFHFIQMVPKCPSQQVLTISKCFF